MPKITAFRSGTCYDCSCDHLVLPDGMDLKAIKAEHDRWYREEYCPGLRGHGPAKVKYISFIERLQLAGARPPTTDELEEVEDY